MKKKDALKLLKHYRREYKGRILNDGTCKLYYRVQKEIDELTGDGVPCSVCEPCVYRLMDAVSKGICVGVGFTPRLQGDLK